MAVGDRNAPPVDSTYTSAGLRLAAPVGSRRGRAVRHARRHGRRPRVPGRRASTSSRSTLVSGSNARFEDIDISINGERVALLEYETGPGRRRRRPRRRVRSGPSRSSSAPASSGSRPRSCARLDGPYEDLIRPHDWSFAGGGSGGPGITTLPHVRDLIDQGPVHRRPASPRRRAARRSSAAGRRVAAEERPCARQIVTRLGGEAYRRPLTAGRDRSPDAVLRSKGAGAARSARRRGRRVRGRRPHARSRRFSRARTSSSASRRSRDGARRAARTASPTSISRRGSRSSSGARRRTRNC